MVWWDAWRWTEWVHDLLSSRLHLACVAGPDAGLIIPLNLHWQVVGRECTGLNDPQVSRQHCRIRLREGRRTCGVEIEDLGSANGVYVGRKHAALVGFAPTWITARRRHRAVGGAGSTLIMGQSIFEVRALAQHLSFDTITVKREEKQRYWRGWMLLLPALSLTWFVARFIGWAGALGALVALAGAVAYVSRARRSWTRAHDPIALMYGLALQPVQSRCGENQPWTIDLTPAGNYRRLHMGRHVIVFPTHRPPRTDRSVTVRSGARIGIRPRNSAWKHWIMTQLIVAARGRGIRAIIKDSELWDDDRLLFSIGHVSERNDWDTVVDPGGEPLCRHQAATGDHEPTKSIPSRITLAELPTPVQSGRDGLKAWIGANADGPISIDLVHDGPHALVAGTTGSGKSEALRTWILQLARAYDPQALRIVFVDYKGGAAFRDLSLLPHSEGVVTDLDVDLTERAIAGLSAELVEREKFFANRGFSSLQEWENSDPTTAPPRILCVIDEFRTMIRTHPGLIERFIDAAARGRSLGIHLIAATQSPGGAISPQMRANLTLRICLRTAEVADSVDVIGTAHAAQLPLNPGRGLINDAQHAVQWAWTPSQVVSTYIRQTPASPTLWRQPLPEVLDQEQCPELVGISGDGMPIAIADDIERRRYLPIFLEPGPTQIVATRKDRLSLLNQIHRYCPDAVRIGDTPACAGAVGHTQASQIMVAVRIAQRLHLPIIVDDLAGTIAAVEEELGVGIGRHWWQGVTRAHRAPIVTGAEPTDRFSLANQRSLIRMTETLARSCGYGTDVLEVLATTRPNSTSAPTMVVGWSDLPPLSATMITIGDDQPQELQWRALLEVHPFDQSILHTLRTLDRIFCDVDGTPVPIPRSIRIIGAVPSHVLDICRTLLPVEEVKEYETVRTARELADETTITIVGEVNPHCLSSLKPPLGVRAGTHLWVKWSGWWHKFDKRALNVTIRTGESQ